MGNFLEPDPAARFARLELTNLFHLSEHPDEIPWKPFCEGIEIHRLYGDGVTGPTAALIRFLRKSKVPMHEHLGYEHILVLSGSQRDQNTTAAPGTLMINPPGTRHSIVGEAGCIVLAIYEKPARFEAGEGHGDG
jgi:anti-sigma factor ChrR (cupin superfamily)